MLGMIKICIEGVKGWGRLTLWTDVHLRTITWSKFADMGVGVGLGMPGDDVLTIGDSFGWKCIQPGLDRVKDLKRCSQSKVVQRWHPPIHAHLNLREMNTWKRFCLRWWLSIYWLIIPFNAMLTMRFNHFPTAQYDCVCVWGGAVWESNHVCVCACVCVWLCLSVTCRRECVCVCVCRCGTLGISEATCTDVVLRRVTSSCES